MTDSPRDSGPGWKSAVRKAPRDIAVDDAHPFELDAYIAGYSGNHCHLNTLEGVLIIKWQASALCSA